MGQVLSKAREQLYDCKLVTGKLRAMLQTADEQVRSLKKQSTFLSQLAAKTVPNGIHCLSMRLTIDYYLLPLEKRKFPRSEDLENPNLYHYALFSDNVLAASVVVNSTIMNAKVLQTYYFVIPILLISQIKKKKLQNHSSSCFSSQEFIPKLYFCPGIFIVQTCLSFSGTWMQAACFSNILLGCNCRILPNMSSILLLINSTLER
jgi:hypothetical protein